MQSVRIPRYVDNPAQFLLWEADEIAPALVICGIGIITGTLTYCIVIAYLFHKTFMRFKVQHQRGFLMHLLYRIGLIPLNRKFSNGCITFYHV